MYPAKVTDEQIRSLIRELSVQGALPSGAALRAALQRQYHCRGGVARIYRLLEDERLRRGESPLSAVGTGLLEQENHNLKEQLKHARQREDAHQVHWNREIGQLRERVQTLESLVQQAAASGQVNEGLKQEVARAETRAGQLDLQLRVFGPAASRNKSTE